MSAPCFLCKKIVTRPGLPHHYLSLEHMPLWKECIKRSRKFFLEWISEYEAGKKTIDSKLPSFTLDKESKERYRICFGCKKLERDGMKRHTCDSEENMKKCVEAYKIILNEVVEPEQEETLPSVDVRKMEKRIEQLQKMREVDEERLEKAEAYRDFAKFLIQEIQYESLTAYKEIIEKCEEQYSELKGDVWG